MIPRKREENTLLVTLVEITGNTNIVIDLPENTSPMSPVTMEVNYKKLEAAFWDKKTNYILGVRYERRASRIKSNSGKTTTDWGVSFHGEDGNVIAKEKILLNRRNDPDRNWGLVKE